MRHAVGIDLGGTKILAGVIDLKTGEVVSSAKRRSQVTQEREELLERLVDIAGEVISSARGAKPEAIGIGAAGQIDRERGVLISGPNFGRHMDNLPLGHTLSQKFHLPVTVANDVEVAATGEHYFGAGKKEMDYVCVFVGTGIGGAIVRDGQIYRGATQTAGELGHMVIQSGGRLCGCGGRGHLEAYASRSSIVRYILGEMRGGRKSALQEVVAGIEQPDGTSIRSGALAKAVAGGDELAIEAIADGARYMAEGLASIVNFYNPPRIVLGGGLVQAVDLFFEQTVLWTRRLALHVPRGKTEIVPAGLGDNAGIIGAALLASER
jgi:glucokinase